MIKNQLAKKIIAVFFTINFLQTLLPYNLLYANNNGPNAPEASGFEPVSATDMVNLSSGDMAYVLPLLEIDGFPVTLSYHAGIPMDMEASWVGLGWNINTGTIARGVVANPDDWSNGKRLNLTYLNGHQDSYSVNVGVGIAKAAEVGVGLSWGPNKSLSGSVSASVGPISASIDTNGNYGVGVGISALIKGGAFEGVFDKIGSGDSDSKSPFGASLSISGNVNKGGLSANIGVGGSGKNISGSMGVSISGNGIGGSYSIGGNNNQQGGDSFGGGASASMNSFSAGDFSYNSKGFYIPIQIGIFSFGFGFNRTEITVAKAFQKYGYGVLYHSDLRLYDDINNNLGEDTPDFNRFTDYKKRNEYGDVYEQALPQSEEEFIGDYRNQIEKLNFTFAGYDSYNINATGIGGTLRPIVGENTVLIGEGYDGETIRNDGKDKTKVFYHHASQNLNQTKSIADQNLHFVFDGQITENVKQTGYKIKKASGNNKNLSNFIKQGTYNINNRPKAGSYIETYTNTQIDAGANILTPASLYVDGVNDLNRVVKGYVPEGIGGYKITTPDGKTYHFAQPVYQYEQIQHNYLNFDGVEGVSKYNSSSKREASPYATHWLLTAITGPDFIDNGNNFPDKEDFGYWVRLDHGQWSNAYTWRSPYDNGDYANKNDKTKRHYATYIDNEVEKSDPGYFLQGRKDLYYLDKIVSKTQTAYFVKDIRYDGVGTEADYVFEADNEGSFYFNDQLTNENPAFARENAIYDKEYQLRLDKIVIVNNKEGTDVSNIRNTEVLDGIHSDSNPNTVRYEPGGYFDNNLPIATKTHKLHQSNNILDVEDFQNFDYRKAQKVIKFNHNYLLAKQTPSSEHPNNPDKGRLTLNSVKTFGRGLVDGATEDQLYDYMSPYTFTYEKPNEIHEENELQEIPNSGLPAPFSGVNQRKFIRANKDNWGFRNLKRGDDTSGDGIPDTNIINTIDAWSLKSIKTPQGATIDIEYEEDDFYIEAFSRRFWENNLRIYANTSESNTYTLFYIENQLGIDPLATVDFTDYFQMDEDIYFDYWVSRRRKHSATGHNHWGAVDVNSNPAVVKTIQEVTPTRLTIRINNLQSTIDGCGGTDLIVGCRHGNKGKNRVKNRWFCKEDGCGSRLFQANKRCAIPSAPQVNDDHHNMKYKLLANKVAPGMSGGGLRVKKITVNNNEDHKYLTSYNYKDPYTGKTSGITSFNPVHGEVFVPYQNELPGPGVMYEWVTMSASSIDQNNNENLLSKIRYHYYTLKPVFDIFNPDLDMKDKDEKSIFKTQVNEVAMNQNKIEAKKMSIVKDLSKIGQLISTEEFNASGQLMNKSFNYYKNRKGKLSETFSSMKSVFDFNEDEDGNQNSFELIKRYIAQSTKTEKVSVVKRIDNIAGGLKSSVEYSKPDEYLGTYRNSIRTMADGTSVKEQKIPAYLKYPTMGSKIINPTYRNMLTQEAMTITSVTNERNTQGNPINWKTINANITTWNNNWTYRDKAGIETTPTNSNEKIWRKHENFVWNDAVDTNGTFSKKLTINDFNWGLDATQTNTQWQKISEITRYTHWSTPVETQDINGNYASSKMADNFTKTIAGGNASYTEMFYSGVEYADDDWEAEINIGPSSRVTSKAHTGKYSSGAQYQSFTFITTLKANEHRAGNYKISVWADKEGYENARIVVGGFQSSPKEFNGEKVFAGDWVQLNHYEDLSAGLEEIRLTSAVGEVYYDDFRLHPVYVSMNSYVYDHDTDQLTHILDANNMATEFRYDDAGRLCKTYKEVFDTDAFVGGFKMTNKYKYNYKDVPVTSCQCCDDEVIDFKPLAVNDEINVLTKQNIEIQVTANDIFGGDGPSSNPISIVTQPVNGTATINNAGTPSNPEDDFIDYLPPSNFIGTDIITYQICDADGDCSEATVTITLDTPQFDVYFSDIVYSEPFATTAKLNGIPGSTITYFIENYTTDTFSDSGEGIVIVDGVQTIVSNDFPSSGNKTVVVPAIGYVLCSVEQHETTSDNAFTSLFILEATVGAVDAGSELKDGE